MFSFYSVSFLLDPLFLLVVEIVAISLIEGCVVRVLGKFP